MPKTGQLVGLLVFVTTSLAAQGQGPGGATAKCRDGQFVHGKMEGTACSDHNGVEVWYGLAQNEAVATAKRTDIYSLLEAALERQPPNTVLRADLTGRVEQTFTPDSSAVAANPVFTVFLDRTQQESGCRKVSDHCTLCPTNHKVYCTNVAQFLPLMAF